MQELEEDGPKQPGKNWLDGYVYVIDYGDSKTFKIGYTTTDPKNRHSQITKGLPVKMPGMELVMSCLTSTNCRYLEQLLHMLFDPNHVKGEWFYLTFVDLLEIYMLFNRLGSVELHDRWFRIVPEDAPQAAKDGRLNWVGSLPHLTIAEKEEADNFDFSIAFPAPGVDYE